MPMVGDATLKEILMSRKNDKGGVTSDVWAASICVGVIAWALGETLEDTALAQVSPIIIAVAGIVAAVTFIKLIVEHVREERAKSTRVDPPEE